MNKTAKQKLQETVNYLTEEQCEHLEKVINEFAHGFLTKGTLMKYGGRDTNKIDSALPIDYVRRIQDILPTFKTQFHAFDYNNSHGEMINVAEDFVTNLHKILSE